MTESLCFLRKINQSTEKHWRVVEFVPPIFFLPVQLHCEHTETECPGVNLKNRAEEHVLYLQNMPKT